MERDRDFTDEARRSRVVHRCKCAFWLKLLLAPAVVLLAPATSASNAQIALPAERVFSGTVEEVKQQECEVCKCVELSVMLKTLDGNLEVKLGPKAFLDKHRFVISQGDTIRVTGLRFTVSGKDVALANDVRKGHKRLVLRGKYGKPKWIEEHGHICPVCGN